MIYAVSVLACVIATANAKVYFKENFNDEGWKSRWAIPTDWKAEVIILYLLYLTFSLLISNFNLLMDV